MRMLLDTGTGQLTECTGSPEQAQALADSRLDTVTGACLDYSDSPFNSPGQPCTASFLDSLACRNAVATRRHLPRLAWLHRAPDELRGTVDAAVRAQDWRTHFLQLTALLEDNTTTAERDAAARAVLRLLGMSPKDGATDEHGTGPLPASGPAPGGRGSLPRACGRRAP